MTPRGTCLSGDRQPGHPISPGRRALYFGWLGICLLGSPAAATVGGPTTVEVLGYAPRDGQKIYLLRGGVPGELPRLFFFDPRTPHRGLREAVRFNGLTATEDDGVKFEARLAVVRGWLRPLRRLGSTAVTVQQVERGSGSCLEGESDLGGDRCLTQDVRLSWGGLGGVGRTIGWDAGRLHQAWATPDGVAAVAIWRFTGRTYETGYAEDLVIPLHKTPPPAAGTWRASCGKADCAVWAGERIAWRHRPGQLECVEHGGWVACLWRGGVRRGAHQHAAALIDRRTGRSWPVPTLLRPTEEVPQRLRWAGAELELVVRGPKGLRALRRAGPPAL